MIFQKSLQKSKTAAILLLAAMPLAAQEASEKIDLTVLHDIKSQAFQHSQVMDHLFYISDVYGPRITSSPNHRAAAEWIVKRLESYGLQNVSNRGVRSAIRGSTKNSMALW